MTEVSRPRVARAPAGTLATHPIAVLLASAATRRTTGRFLFDHDGLQDELRVRDGHIASVRTSTAVGYLGGILYEQAVIDSAALNETLREVALARRLHGAVLVERGLVTAEQLEAALVEQTLRRVHHLFSLPEQTAWTFDENLDALPPLPDADRPVVNPWVAIWRGLRDTTLTRHVEGVLKDLEPGLHLRASPELERFGLSAEERSVCDRLVQPSTLARFVAASPYSSQRTLMLIYLLVLGRCVARVHVGAVSPLELGVDGVRTRARAIDSEDPYTVLGLAAGASPEMVRAAYFRLARLWHPDRIPSALDEVRDDCALVFAALVDAHRVLSVRRSGEIRAAHEVLGGGAAVRPATLADVDSALARNDLESAAALATRLSSGGVDGPAARAVVVWCRAGAGTAAHDVLMHACEALQQILAGDPACTRALFYRGQLLKRTGRAESAIRDFRKVVRLDGRHLEAQREVRLHDMRLRNGSNGSPRDSEPHGAPARRASGSAAVGAARESTSADPTGTEAGRGIGAVRSAIDRWIARAART